MASRVSFASRLSALQPSCLQLRLEETPPGAVLWLYLDRPSAFNAISMEMLEELHRVADLLAHPLTMHAALPTDWPRVLVLSGRGPAFSGGVDIKAAKAGIGGQAWDYTDLRSQQLLSRLIEKLRRLPQPIIAAVNGPASGGGFALALASDVRVATRSARFDAAFVKLGLTGCDMGTSYHLPRVAGQGVAAELLLTGRPLSAERAFTLGLVNELVDDVGALEAAARGLARDMLACSARGLQLTKAQLNAAADGGSLATALAAEDSHQMLLVNDPVSRAIADRWVETLLSKSKRAPPRSKL